MQTHRKSSARQKVYFTAIGFYFLKKQLASQKGHNTIFLNFENKNTLSLPFKISK